MAQIWLFFANGVGGDGLANLLEHAQEVKVWDRSSVEWRIHRIVDEQVKFWAPTVDQQHCFRTGRWFDQRHNRLHQGYQRAVEDGHTIVVTSHDILLLNLSRSDGQQVLCRDQCRVLLDSRDYLKCYQNSVIKNLITVPDQDLHDSAAANAMPVFARYSETDRSRFDHVVWMEDLTTPASLEAFARDLGLTLDIRYIEQYQQLRSGMWRQIWAARPEPPRYVSHTVGGLIRYKTAI